MKKPTYTLHSRFGMDGKTRHSVRINGVEFVPVEGGCLKVYPGGVRVFISNNWFE